MGINNSRLVPNAHIDMGGVGVVTKTEPGLTGDLKVAVGNARRDSGISSGSSLYSARSSDISRKSSQASVVSGAVTAHRIPHTDHTSPDSSRRSSQVSAVGYAPTPSSALAAVQAVRTSQGNQAVVLKGVTCTEVRAEDLALGLDPNVQVKEETRRLSEQSNTSDTAQQYQAHLEENPFPFKTEDVDSQDCQYRGSSSAMLTTAQVHHPNEEVNLEQVAEGEMVENKLVIPDEMMQYLNQSILGTEPVSPAKLTSKKQSGDSKKDSEEKTSDVATSDDSLLKNLGAIGSDLNISDIPLGSLDVSMSGNSGSLLPSKTPEDNPLQEQIIPEKSVDNEETKKSNHTSATTQSNPLNSLQNMANQSIEPINRIRLKQQQSSPKPITTQTQNVMSPQNVISPRTAAMSPMTQTMMSPMNVLSPQSIAQSMLSPQSRHSMSPASVMSPQSIPHNVLSPSCNVMSPMNVMSPQQNAMSPPHHMMSPGQGSPMIASPRSNINMPSPMTNLHNMSSPINNINNVPSPMSNVNHMTNQISNLNNIPNSIANMNNISNSIANITMQQNMMNMTSMNRNGHNQITMQNLNLRNPMVQTMQAPIMHNIPQNPMMTNQMTTQCIPRQTSNCNDPNSKRIPKYNNESFINQNSNQMPYPIQNFNPNMMPVRPYPHPQMSMTNPNQQHNSHMHQNMNQQMINYVQQQKYNQTNGSQNQMQLQHSHSSMMSVDNSGNMGRGMLNSYDQSQKCPPNYYSQQYSQPPPYNSINPPVMGPPPPKPTYNNNQNPNMQYYNRIYNQWDYQNNQHPKNGNYSNSKAQNSVNMSTESQPKNGIRTSGKKDFNEQQTDCSMNSIRSQNQDVQVYDISQSQIESTNNKKKNNQNNSMRQETYQRTLEYVQNCESWKSSEMVTSSTHPLQNNNMVVNDLQTSLTSFYEENQYLQMIQ